MPRLGDVSHILHERTLRQNHLHPSEVGAYEHGLPPMRFVHSRVEYYYFQISSVLYFSLVVLSLLYD